MFKRLNMTYIFFISHSHGTESSGTSVEISELLLHNSDDKMKAVKSDDDDRVSEWKDQITVRGLRLTLLKRRHRAARILLGQVMDWILGHQVMDWPGLSLFTMQENNFNQTCIVALLWPRF
ncbi:hypothetical protein C1H46_031670 [Malus baccata]|uniref:Uncharacterized protein n=1 Tax=Malus baccata TaxID=106549 RepID=A0A540L8G5_MALBA|nr:hypothetical protein C1H46_031670 [Malus baccata]